MKFSITQDAFLENLKTVSRAVSSANTLPVLGNILIKAEGKKVYFSATNLEISISASCEAVVKNEGALTIPAKILTAYTSLLTKKEDMEIAAAGGNALEIKSKSSKTKIKGIAADEFPAITKVEGGTKFEVPSKDFREAVQKVAFAAQENSSRPILSGVFFNFFKGELRMAATDSYRLSEKVIKPANKDAKDITCIIPVRAVLEADRLSGSEEKITISISENQILFAMGATQLVSRLIDGQFPDYTQIIPKTAVTVAEVNREELDLAVRRVSIFAKENNQHMKWEFLKDGTLTVFTDATEIGEEKTTIPVQITGEANMIALNSDYVQDVLSAMSGEEKVKIQLEGKSNPAVFRRVKDDSFTHLIMPLKM